MVKGLKKRTTLRTQRSENVLRTQRSQNVRERCVRMRRTFANAAFAERSRTQTAFAERSRTFANAAFANAAFAGRSRTLRSNAAFANVSQSANAAFANVRSVNAAFANVRSAFAVCVRTLRSNEHSRTHTANAEHSRMLRSKDVRERSECRPRTQNVRDRCVRRTFANAAFAGRSRSLRSQDVRERRPNVRVRRMFANADQINVRANAN